MKTEDQIKQIIDLFDQAIAIESIGHDFERTLLKAMNAVLGYVVGIESTETEAFQKFINDTKTTLTEYNNENARRSTEVLG